MAAEIHDHMHIGTANPPIETYAVLQGSWEYAPVVPAAVDYAIDGTVHVHRLIDEDEEIIQYENATASIICTLAEMLTLRGLISQIVYYVNNYHDDAEDGGSLDVWPDSEYVKRGILKVSSMMAYDPMCTYWRVDFQFIDIKAGP